MPGRTMAERRLRVIWQAPTREFFEVGQLTLPSEDGGTFRFRYQARLPSGFNPFLAFPDPERIYESPRLFPFFQNRVMSAERPEYDDHLAALGLTRDEATPFEILARTAGETPTDTVQVVPDAEERSDGRVTQPFLASGVRHVPEAEQTLRELAPRDILQLVKQPDNESDPQAIRLITHNNNQVGWVPSYLLDMVHNFLDSDRPLKVTVIRVNDSSVPWHLRLLCRLEAGESPGA